MWQRTGRPQSMAGKRKPQQRAPCEHAPTPKWHRDEVRRHRKKHSLAWWCGRPWPLELSLRGRSGGQRCRRVCLQARSRPAERARSSTAQAGAERQGVALTDQVFPLLSASGCPISSCMAVWGRENTLEHPLRAEGFHSSHLPMTDRELAKALSVTCSCSSGHHEQPV